MSIDDILIGRGPATPPTQEQINKAAVEMVMAVGEAIRDLGEVPSGHLYAGLMGCMTLDTYNRVITTLENAELVRNVGHLLTWVGPKIKKL